MYLEMTFAEFEKKFPRTAQIFPAEALQDFRKDPNYIVRLNNEGVEIGYRSDEWHIVTE